MSGTFGIEKPRQIETRLQRLVILGIRVPGALPQARVELRAFGAKRTKFPLLDSRQRAC